MRRRACFVRVSVEDYGEMGGLQDGWLVKLLVLVAGWFFVKTVRMKENGEDSAYLKVPTPPADIALSLLFTIKKGAGMRDTV